MKLLLHACCGPCAIFPLGFLRETSHEVRGYFYNPNIHPYKEYERRLLTFQEFSEKVQLEIIIQDDYDLEGFLSMVNGREQIRCGFCYRMRLREAARIAAEQGFDAFTTSLLVSPYQKHDLIKQAGEEAGEEFRIPFYYHDFRTGYREGVSISREMNLYRQPYCGCIYSERDRYRKEKKK